MSLDRSPLETNDIAPKTKTIKSKNKFIIRFGIILAIFAVAVIAMGLYINEQNKIVLYQIETINGIPVKGMKVSQAVDLLYEHYNEKRPFVQINQPEREIKIDLTLLGYELDKQKLTERVKEISGTQSLILSPLKSRSEMQEELEVPYRFSSGKLNERLEDFRAKTREDYAVMPEQDAYILFDEQKNIYVIEEEKMGNVEDEENSLTNLTVFLNENSEISTAQNPENYTDPILKLDLNEVGWYKKPVINAENQKLIEYKDLFNNNFRKEIEINVFGDEKRKLLPKDYANLLNYSAGENKLFIDQAKPPELDLDKLNDFVVSYCRSINTFGIKRKFMTSEGKEITITVGDYGWWVNFDKTMDNFQASLIKLLKGEEPDVINTVFWQTAARLVDKSQPFPNDYGNSYVEISLAKQHLWYYINGKLFLESDIVSGNPNNKNATPVGIYSITYKERQATLTGPNYRTPVEYWMPFNKDVGLHDATWQPIFGGNRYLSNGSNGCINLPFEIAKNIYSKINKFDPVIVY